MTAKLPSKEDFMNYRWEQIAPYYETLLAQDLSAENIEPWMRDWSQLVGLVQEYSTRRRLKSLQDTTDEEAEAAYQAYLEDVYPPFQRAHQAMIEKLLASGLEPAGLELQIKSMKVDAELFREENLPLQAEEQKKNTAFNKIVGVQSVEWAGEEYTITRLAPLYQASDRSTRQAMWERVNAREQQDRPAINALWSEYMEIRGKQAANAGYPGDYRAYRWQYLNRFDYTPEDCQTFHTAIESVAVPAAQRIYRQYREDRGLQDIRPWDLDLYQQTYPLVADDLQPFKDGEELAHKGSAVFHQVDPVLGGYFDTLREEGFLDLENRKGKGPGAFCTTLTASRRPFIFMNGVGLAGDVNTLLHEAGHAFHAFESFSLPYNHQRWSGMEFAEVASTAMELLAAPYLTRAQGGFYSDADAALARKRHLEKMLLFWPYMAVVDAFQHWVYENPGRASDPGHCDQAWADQWDRFIPGINWEGLEEAKTIGWHRKRHIHRSPFYYIEYGLAQLGAVQIWGNALRDQAGAVRDYRGALALGGTVTIPELYARAGGKFAFDTDTLKQAVDLLEQALDGLGS